VNRNSQERTLGDRLPIRVGFVIHRMQVAGAEMLVAETIRRLIDRIRPVVFCLDGLGSLGRQIKLQGVPVVWLGRRPGIDIGLAFRLGTEIRNRKVELLHAHQYTPFFYSAMAKMFALSRVPLVLTEHGRHFPDRVSPVRRGLNRTVFRHLANEINGCSRFSCRALSEIDGFPAEEISVIENGVELARYSRAEDRRAARAQLGLQPERIYAVTVARFHPVKDHATLMEAFEKVCRQRQDIDLLLVGDGPLRDFLAERARELGIGHRVIFLGVRPDVPEILGIADLFIMTSLSEAASLTVLEAMASELPVVLTEVGGNPEMVTNGKEGLLVPRKGADQAAEAMLRLIENPELSRRMGSAGRQRVEDRYQMNHTVERYWGLYRRLSEPGVESG